VRGFAVRVTNVKVEPVYVAGEPNVRTTAAVIKYTGWPPKWDVQR